MTAGPVEKGQWYQMPSGKLVQVCKLETIRAPMKDGDTSPQQTVEVTLRFLNDDGAMAPGKFVLDESFIAKHCKRIHVAPVGVI